MSGEGDNHGNNSHDMVVKEEAKEWKVFIFWLVVYIKFDSSFKLYFKTWIIVIGNRYSILKSLMFLMGMIIIVMYNDDNDDQDHNENKATKQW